MITGKAYSPFKFKGNKKDLESGLLQINEYFIIIQTYNKQQRLTYVSLYSESEVLEWWKANRARYTTWEGVQDAMRVL